jgi:hypothetical protein
VDEQLQNDKEETLELSTVDVSESVVDQQNNVDTKSSEMQDPESCDQSHRSKTRRSR